MEGVRVKMNVNVPIIVVVTKAADVPTKITATLATLGMMILPHLGTLGRFLSHPATMVVVRRKAFAFTATETVAMLMGMSMGTIMKKKKKMMVVIERRMRTKAAVMLMLMLMILVMLMLMLLAMVVVVVMLSVVVAAPVARIRSVALRTKPVPAIRSVVTTKIVSAVAEALTPPRTR